MMKTNSEPQSVLREQRSTQNGAPPANKNSNKNKREHNSKNGVKGKKIKHEKKLISATQMLTEEKIKHESAPIDSNDDFKFEKLASIFVRDTKTREYLSNSYPEYSFTADPNDLWLGIGIKQYTHVLLSLLEASRQFNVRFISDEFPILNNKSKFIGGGATVVSRYFKNT